MPLISDVINTQHWKTSVFQHSQQWKHEEKAKHTHLKDLKKSQNYLSLHRSPKQDCNTSRNRACWEERWVQLQCLQEQSHDTPHTLLTSQEALALRWAHEQYSSSTRGVPSPAELRKPWHTPECPSAVQLASAVPRLLQTTHFNRHQVQTNTHWDTLQWSLEWSSCFLEHNCSGDISKQTRARSDLRLNTQLWVLFRVWVDNFARM